MTPQGQTLLGLVPARAGSKGIPEKNSRPLAGKPLLQYVSEYVQSSPSFDRVILSTDSPAIRELGQSFGLDAPFLRPDDLAQDDTPMLPVIEHALEWVESQGEFYTLIALLQPTAPLRNPRQLKDALEIMESTGADSVVGVVPVPEHYNPYFTLKIEQERLSFLFEKGGGVTRRQDLPPVYSRDGSLYLFRVDSFRKHGSIYGKDCRPLIIDPASSVNLDTLTDWEEAEWKISRTVSHP